MAKEPKPKKAPAAKKAAAFNPSSLGLRAPAKLPPLSGFDPELDAAIVALDAAWSEARRAAFDRVSTRGTAADLPHVLARLSPEAFDMGSRGVVLPPGSKQKHPAEELSPKDRRTYQRAFDSVYGARENRKYYLQLLATQALTSDDGDARVGQGLGASTDPELAGCLARIIVRARRPKSLAALARFYAGEGPCAELEAWAGAAAARTLGDSPGFLEETKALWAVPVAELSQDNQIRVSAILDGLSWLGMDAPPAWRERAEAAVSATENTCTSSALRALVAMGIQPSFEGKLGAYLEERMLTRGFTDGIQELASIATARSSHLFAMALDLGALHDFIFDTLARLGDARTTGAVRRFVKKHEQRDPATWPTLARAIQLLGTLEALGAAAPGTEFAPPPPKAAIATPPRRKPAPKAKWPKAEPVLAQRAELDELLAKAGLQKHASSLIHSGMQLLTRRVKPSEIPIGATRLGGCPDLPEGKAWPLFEGRPLWFVGQLRLEDFAPHDAEKRLPPGGLLSFFVDDVDEDAYLESCAVLFSEAATALVRLTAPAALLAPKGIPPRLVDADCAVEVRPLVMLASANDSRVRSLLSEKERAAYVELPSWDGFHRVLGACGGVVNPADNLLFQCVSDEQADMQWGDFHHLCFCIEPDALAQRDFGRVTSAYLE